MVLAKGHAVERKASRGHFRNRYKHDAPASERVLCGLTRSRVVLALGVRNVFEIRTRQLCLHWLPLAGAVG